MLKAYGRVHPARLVETGEKVALKKISKKYTNSASFNSETDALLRIYDNGGHPNISGLRDMYEDYSHFYLFLDLARGGEMFDHLIQHGQYSEFDASRLVTEILSALAFLHNIGVIHADLKPENILLCSKKKGAETVKLIDFGCASVDERGESLFSQREDANTTALSIGTKAYWSPERFDKSIPITDAVDLYAVGVILFIMLVGVHPFDTTGIASDEEIEASIQKSATPPMNLTAHLSPSARDFIKSLMERDPNERLTAIAALNHPWIRGVTPKTNVIEGCKLACVFAHSLSTVELTNFAALCFHSGYQAVNGKLARLLVHSLSTVALTNALSTKTCAINLRVESLLRWWMTQFCAMAATQKK